jgi:hypothetical protein
MAMTADRILRDVREVASGFAADRRQRQQRRALVADDFARLRDAGLLRTGVPLDQGGMWEDAPPWGLAYDALFDMSCAASG